PRTRSGTTLRTGSGAGHREGLIGVSRSSRPRGGPWASKSGFIESGAWRSLLLPAYRPRCPGCTVKVPIRRPIPAVMALPSGPLGADRAPVLPHEGPLRNERTGRREAVLEVLSYAVQRLRVTSEWRQPVGEILGQLGVAC